jgi:hypothetical protein
MPDVQYAAKPTLSFAKIVASPSESAWSQAYNAGNLFVCLSLFMPEPVEGVSLLALGKDVFNLLQSEFFSLEEKTPDAIKEAIRISTSKVPEGVDVSIALANFKDHSLTVFIAGSGKIVMKRREKVGTLLQKQGTFSGETTFASGFLENGDTVVLETGQFAQGVTLEQLKEALDLDLPNDIVESLSPAMHAHDNGAQSAIVVRFSGPTPPTPQETVAEDEKVEEPKDEITEKEASEPESEKEPEEEATLGSVASEPAIEEHPDKEDTEKPELVIEKESFADEEDEQPKSSGIHLPTLPSMPKPGMQLTHKRKLYLSIAVILFFLLAISIFFTVTKQNDEQRQAIFKDVYASAQKDYETGQGIESLNPEGSRENYLRAESTLKEGKEKIAAGTEEYKQIEDLLAKVTAELQGAPEPETNTLQEAEPPANSLIAVAKDNSGAKGFGQNTTTVYMINNDVVTSVTKSNGNKKELVENDKDWTSPQAVVPYQSNFYVLDQKNGVLKFVPSGDTYTKSSYFTGTAPNLSKATGMAIDSSVWIVTSDGKVLKYTRGSQDTFGITGIDKPLRNPSKIVTDGTMESIYVMDNGNRRIVKFDKKGAFQKAYPAGVIANAKEFDIDQKDNRILILANDKVYALPL